MVRSNYTSNVLFEDKPIPTIGKLLDHKLHSGYYVCVPDFCGPISFPMVDLATKSIKYELISPTMNKLALLEKKDRYFQPTDATALKEVLPNMIPFIKERAYILVSDGSNTAPFDALFLYKTLSVSDPIANQ